ncbi:MAG: hypothetical protein ABI041_19905, partial [Bdellovibrionia bacterium]
NALIASFPLGSAAMQYTNHESPVTPFSLYFLAHFIPSQATFLFPRLYLVSTLDILPRSMVGN